MSFRPVTECRSCGCDRIEPVLDLGLQPLANGFRSADDTAEEPRYPLATFRCENCSLVQLTGTVDPSVMFDHYHYFSSVSTTMVETGSRLVDRLIEQERLGDDSLVVEVASNDGYLLRRYVERGIEVLGIDPAANVAEHAIAAGVATQVDYFSTSVAQALVDAGRRAAVIHANNVIAHVPDINDFVAGLALLLHPAGTLVVETPHVVTMVDGLEFDTIYHEHVFYYSLHALQRLFARHGLAVVDVEEIALHGGSLRVFAREAPADASPRVTALLEREAQVGVTTSAYYADFAARVASASTTLVAAVDGMLAAGERVAAYGAAAKGTVLLNHCGLRADRIEFVADRSVQKQGLVMPGVGIPIVPHTALVERRPDATLLLAWNFADEIAAQQSDYLAAGGRFIVPMPEPRSITA